MLINSYCYAPHNHSILAEHMDADLEKNPEIAARIEQKMDEVRTPSEHLN